jgi:hypothetical protein
VTTHVPPYLRPASAPGSVLPTIHTAERRLVPKVALDHRKLAKTAEIRERLRLPRKSKQNV